MIASRAVDPDPHGSAFIVPPGSGSRRETFEGKNRKHARKLVVIVILFEKLSSSSMVFHLRVFL